jgi:hypothetical protein
MNRKITIYDIILTYFILMYVVYMFIVKEDIFYVYTDYIKFIIDRDRAREYAMTYSEPSNM